MSIPANGKPVRHITPAEAAGAIAKGALLVDIRTQYARASHGLVRGAFVVDRSDFIRYFGPLSPERLPIVAERPIVVFCSASAGTTKYIPLIEALGVSNVCGIEGGYPSIAASGLFILEKRPDR